MRVKPVSAVAARAIRTQAERAMAVIRGRSDKSRLRPPGKRSGAEQGRDLLCIS
jgi:hypothetical protein